MDLASSAKCCDILQPYQEASVGSSTWLWNRFYTKPFVIIKIMRYYYLCVCLRRSKFIGSHTFHVVLLEGDERWQYRCTHHPRCCKWNNNGNRYWCIRSPWNHCLLWANYSLNLLWYLGALHCHSWEDCRANTRLWLKAILLHHTKTN